MGQQGLRLSSFKLSQFGVALESCLPDLELCAKQKAALPVGHIFLEDLIKLAMHPKGEPKVWLVMACQFYIDMFEIAGPDFSIGVSQCQERLTSNLAAIRQCRTLWCSAHPVDNATDLFQGMLTKEAVLEQFLRCVSNETYQKVVGEQSPTGRSCALSCRFFQAFPTMVGSVTVWSAIIAHRLGTWAGSLDLLSAAYLYQAALMSGALTTPWVDMDFLIESQSKKKPFVMKPKQGLSSIPNCFALALGVKFSAFKKGKRPLLPRQEILERDGGRTSLESNFPLLITVFPQGNGKDPVSRSTWPYVEAAIQSVERLNGMELKDDRLIGLYKVWKNTGKLTPVQLLLGFKESYITDEMALMFDHTSFLLSFSTLVKSISSSCAAGLRKTAQERKTTQLTSPDMVYAILCDAADRSGNSDKLTRSMLFEVGKAMEAMIKEEGAKYTSIARDQTKGHVASSRVGTSAAKHGDIDEEVLKMAKFLGLPAPNGSSATGESTFCNPKELEARATICKAVDQLVSGNLDGSEDEIGEAINIVMSENLSRLPEEERAKMIEWAAKSGIGPL